MKRLRQRRFGSAFCVPPTCAALFLFSAQCLGQETTPQQSPAATVEGYVTAIHPPGSFDANGERIVLMPTTRYAWFGNKDANGNSAQSGDIQPGMYVEVAGTKTGLGLTAETVRLREEPDKRIKGLGLVVRVITPGPEPVIEADGYRIHILTGTRTAFSSPLKSLADVEPSIWVKYEGKRDKTGELVATQAEFYPARFSKIKAAANEIAYGHQSRSAADAPKQDEALTQESLIDSYGNLVSAHTKVRLSQAEGWCGWHKVPADQALQKRVLRVGRSVVPAYQKQLSPGDPSRIPFRFYAVEDADNRFALSCDDGLILVPRHVVERLRNDDQLAAVLADGVAFTLVRQGARLSSQDKLLLGSEIAGYVAFGSLGMLAAGEATGEALSHESYSLDLLVALEEQCGRIALALMADAGYDPWQAPEAWRLLAPKKLPADTITLKYPDRSGYQLAILGLQYKRGAAANADSTVASTTAPAMTLTGH